MDLSNTEREHFDELCFYTLAHNDRRFIHQHVVDAFTAQHAEPQTKSIAVAFALIGLYLHIEKGYSGRQVQLAHMQLAKRRRQWPQFLLPIAKAKVSVTDVLAAPAGPERDQAIDHWCRSVWRSWKASHAQVEKLVDETLWPK